MAVVTASLTTLPFDILTRIALASLSQDIPTPSDLASLLALVFTSSAIHEVLSLKANPHLYATIFRLMFDTAAIKRRLGPAAVVTSALAKEFSQRIEILIRIRAASEQGYWDSAQHRDDWNQHGNSYVRNVLSMMMENEEKNSYQLGCARVLKVSDSLVSTLLRYGLESTPPSHQPCMTLTFALMWMLNSQG
jgi:hypothetical protein